MDASQEATVPKWQRVPIPPEVLAWRRAAIKRGLAEGQAFRLLPRRDVYLFAPTFAGSDGARFAGLFRDTWRRLPLWVRRSILKHWRTDPFPLPLFKPEIELVPDWEGRVAGRGLRGDMACVKARGHTMRFWTRIVAAFPDELVRDLIAHELAHVCQWSIGRDLLTMDNYETEEEADWWVERWGFSADTMDQWMLVNGHIKMIDPAKLSPSQRRRINKRSRESGRF